MQIDNVTTRVDSANGLSDLIRTVSEPVLTAPMVSALATRTVSKAVLTAPMVLALETRIWTFSFNFILWHYT
jgi:hypothetical protein